MREDKLQWRVLLIGGGSGTGKTVVGRALAGRLGISLLLVDDLRLAIQAVTSPEQHPALHTFVTADSAAMGSPQSVLDGLIAVAEAMAPAVRIVIAHHLVVAGAGAIIIEGDGLLPHLVSPRHLATLEEFRGVPVAGMVRTLLLHEEDEAIIRENMIRRGRGFQDMPHAQQEAMVVGSWQFGQYLYEQAAANDMPTVPSRPHGTLLERVMTAMDLGER